MPLTPCPLCSNKQTTLHYQNSDRDFLKCSVCALVFVPAKFHLKPCEEKAIYDQHRNNPNDSGYRGFLNKLVAPLISNLNQYNFSAAANGLDFGSGPGPTLSIMLNEMGYNVSNYDIYYANEFSVLNKKYDFITSTEVWEHLSQPKEIINKLFQLGKDRFVLGIMTKRLPNTPFENWHYIKDPTHITFFADQTLKFIAQEYSCELQMPENDTALFIRA